MENQENNQIKENSKFENAENNVRRFKRNVQHQRHYVNNMFKTVDAYVYDAGIQGKTQHFWEAKDNPRDIFQFVIEGEGVLECGGNVYNLTKHSLFLLPKHTHVKYYANKTNHYKYYWVSFSGVYAETLLKQSGFSEQNPVRQVEDSRVKNCFKKIFELMKISSGEVVNASIQPSILSAFYQIFSILIEENAVQEGKIPPNILVNNAVEIMNSHYSDGITVSDICGKMFINRCYFSVLFKREMKQSPGEYLMNLRIMNSCKLLKETKMPTKIIANSVGFSPNNFYKLFNKKMGCSPTEYRRENS